MSDTHDNLPKVDRAVEKMNAENVELVLHAGDYVAPFVVARFGALKAKLIGVFGNNDGDHELLKKRFGENKNLEIRGNFARVDGDGAIIALLHGHDEELLKTLVEGECCDIIVHGHAHKAASYTRGKTLVVSPGEVCGYLTGKCTIGTLDTSSRKMRIIQI